MRQTCNSGIVFLALGLSLAATSASADSAWVLWQSVSYPQLSKYSGRRWDIAGSFPSFEQCSASLDRMARFDPLAAQPRPGQEFTVRANESKVWIHLRSQDEPSIWYDIELSCLPETVDPRR